MWRPIGCALLAHALSAQTQSPRDQPQYYDEPQFIAAGVEDAANRGGHGSDTLVRSSDALARATASLSAGTRLTESEQSLESAIARDPNNSQLHYTLAGAEEKLGKPLEALREYRRAVELEPSEAHLFDLGSELLLHRAAEQAATVYSRGVGMFPGSVRMLLGLAAACYSRGLYDEAQRYFFEAIDRSPGDPQSYLFLGQTQSSPIAQSAGYAERMARFLKLFPDNAWANYYYAVNLRSRAPATNDAQAQSLLEKAVRLDPKFGLAWLELGIVYADRHDDAHAIASWQSAIAASPQLPESHYRLAQAYRRIGQSGKAAIELEAFEQLKKQATDADERDRSSIKQFVFKLRER